MAKSSRPSLMDVHLMYLTSGNWVVRFVQQLTVKSSAMVSSIGKYLYIRDGYHEPITRKLLINSAY